jgi:trk system potassium uptake protein TrkA
MRVVIVGASEVAVNVAQLLIKRHYEVVLIETERAKIETLSEQLDCSFLHGDGSKPHILREAAPEQTDFLFCLTDNDQDNIIASLVGRSMGFSRVVTKIRDSDFESICLELGLEDIIIPSRAIATYLVDMVGGISIPDTSTMIKGEARLFAFIVKKETALRISDLELPSKARVICYYRGGQFMLPDPETALRERDEVVILTHSEHLAALQERYLPKPPEKDTSD